MGSEN